MLKTISPQLQKEIDKYFNLHIDGKLIKCPYFINNKVIAGNLRVMSGKGSAEEIELETKIWAKVKGFDLDKANESEIRNFLIEMKIGIDCSGFISNVINNYLLANGQKALVKHLKFANNSILSKLRRFLRPIENIGAYDMTSELNTEKITDLNIIEPGDLIRAKGPQRNAHHVAMITEVEIDDATNKVKRFKYVNSHRYYENENGVRYGEVIVTNPEGDLKDQEWTDVLNGRNYIYEDLMVEYEDNGIRRLKNVEFKV